MADWEALARIERGVHEGLHLGAQLYVSLRGEVVASAAMGTSQPDVPMTDRTLVPWLSASKPLTAAAVLQQWERGGLDLDDPVVHHIPAFGASESVGPSKSKVTLRHLLTHTAGLPAVPESLDEACAASLEVDWTPGRRAAYRPRGAFMVLGEVVSRVDGRPFADYVSEELIEPLGMADSWFGLPPQRHAAYGDRIGRMYVTQGGRMDVMAEVDGPDALAQVRPSLGGIGPMADLGRFYEMLLGKGQLDGVRVLSAQTAEAMVARHRAGLQDETFGTEMDWGLGIMSNSWHYRRQPTPYGYGEHASFRAYGHGGNQSSIAFADPELGLAVALAFNGMPGEAANHQRTQPVLTALYQDLGLAS